MFVRPFDDRTPQPRRSILRQGLLALCSSVLFFAPAAQAGVPPEDPETAFPYATWQSILERVVDERGMVDYDALADDPAALDEVVAAVARVSPVSHPQLFADRNDELAYYLNAYNALVFRSALDLGPEVDTVWGKSGTGLGFFVRRKVIVGDEPISLKKLEDDRVRAEFSDPRIHAALNCASIGCPRLPTEPFLPASLDAQLDAAMAEFVAEERNVRADGARRHVMLSKIFDWFEQDFLDYEREAGSAEPHLIDYVNRYRASDAQIPTSYRIKFDKYDKRLNRQAR